MTAEQLRADVFASLKSQGFQPADSLPLPEVDSEIRPTKEIAARLMALNAVIAKFGLGDKQEATAQLESHIDSNGLRDWMNEDEIEIIGMWRPGYDKQQMGVHFCKLSNLWALAWVLGFEAAPSLKPDAIGDQIQPLREFLPSRSDTVDAFLARCNPRAADEVIALEYLFYCAHNAVRSALLGHNTVPPRFFPRSNGHAVREHLHSLTWCISPRDS